MGAVKKVVAVKAKQPASEAVGRELTQAKELVDKFLNADGKPAEGALALLQKAGITDDILGAVLAEGLKATQEVSQGRDQGTATVADYYARHKYLVVALMLKQYMGGKGEAMGNNTFSKTINLYCSAEAKPVEATPTKRYSENA